MIEETRHANGDLLFNGISDHPEAKLCKGVRDLLIEK
jgi:hypothetical protein